MPNGLQYQDASAMPQGRAFGIIGATFNQELTGEKTTLHNLAQRCALTVRQQLESEAPDAAVIMQAWQEFRHEYDVYSAKYGHAISSLKQQGVTDEHIAAHHQRTNSKFDPYNIAVMGIGNRMKGSLFAQQVQDFLTADSCNLALLADKEGMDSANRFIHSSAGAAIQR